jgi:hypothetical protein
MTFLILTLLGNFLFSAQQEIMQLQACSEPARNSLQEIAKLVVAAIMAIKSLEQCKIIFK